MSFQIFNVALVLLSGWMCASEQKDGIKLDKIISLPAELDECSGMATLSEGLFLANNDSGSPAELHVFSINKDSKTRTIKIENAKNQDWEELAEDETYIYIGDFGNNLGNRKNLAIYRVLKSELLESDKVNAEIIEFSYPEQVDFNKSKETNFDCEAMVSIGDSLYLFTKNHGDSKSSYYSMSNVPGTYSATFLGSLKAEGLITGADYRLSKGKAELVLVGYTDKSHGHRPFLVYYKDLKAFDLLNSPSKRYQLKGQLQLETILFEDQRNVLISSEGKMPADRSVFRVKI